MKVHFGQIYIEPRASFPFSYRCQQRISREVTALVKPSPKFIKTYGTEFKLMFNVSAKCGIRENKIKGPSVFRKSKNVEYTIFLPFDVIIRDAEAPKSALRFLLEGVYKIFDALEISKSKLVERQDELINGICSDPAMLEERSWDEAENRTRVRRVFEAYFASKPKRRKSLGSSE
jgi:hypothetical protein